jgi:hypothetical protein
MEHEKKMAQEASKSNPTRKFHFISAAEYILKYELIHSLATVTERESTSTSHSVPYKPWEHYGRIGEYHLSLRIS